MHFHKQFNDEHESDEMLQLAAEFGTLQATGFLSILRQICAGKLHKERDQILTERDCVFLFPRKNLQQKLGLSPKKLQKMVELFAEVGFFSVESDAKNIKISMPNLLKSLDRDAKRTRPRRGPSAARPGLELDIELDKERRRETAASPLVVSAHPPKEETKMGQMRERLTGRGVDFAYFLKNWPRSTPEMDALAALLSLDLKALASFPTAYDNFLKRVADGRYKSNVWHLHNFIRHGHWREYIKDEPLVDAEFIETKHKIIVQCIKDCRQSNSLFEKLLTQHDPRLAAAVKMAGGFEWARMTELRFTERALKGSIRKAFTQPLNPEEKPRLEAVGAVKTQTVPEAETVVEPEEILPEAAHLFAHIARKHSQAR